MARGISVAPTSKISERLLSELISGFLKLDGWRVLKQEPLSRAGGGRYAGELGMPDILCLRYAEPHRGRGNAILWIEAKRKGGKPKPLQAYWHAAERALGAEIWVCDDFEEFKVKYLGSGLNRRMR